MTSLTAIQRTIEFTNSLFYAAFSITSHDHLYFNPNNYRSRFSHRVNGKLFAKQKFSSIAFEKTSVNR